MRITSYIRGIYGLIKFNLVRYFTKSAYPFSFFFNEIIYNCIGIKFNKTIRTLVKVDTSSPSVDLITTRYLYVIKINDL